MMTGYGRKIGRIGGVTLLSILLPMVGEDNAYAADKILTGAVRVIDGDTLDLAGQRIRLHGIDAPESKQTCQDQDRDYSCGTEATEHLKALIAGRILHCESKGTDRYRRVIAVCVTPDGHDINRVMVRDGMALAYRRYSMDYVEDEHDAKAAQRGLWRGDFISPWQWRKRKQK